MNYVNLDGIAYSADELDKLFTEIEAEHIQGPRETLLRAVQRTGLERDKLARFAAVRRMAKELV